MVRAKFDTGQEKLDHSLRRAELQLNQSLLVITQLVSLQYVTPLVVILG